METLLNILQFIAKIFLYLGQGILWMFSFFDVFGIGKFFNGNSGKDSVTKIATEDLPDNKDLPK